MNPQLNDMKPVVRPKYRFPWQEGNHFRLLVDGDQFFPVMMEAIENARCHVLFEMYLFESGQVADRFIEALTSAASRGAGVYLLLDDFGASGLHKRDRQRLKSGGVRVALYNPFRYGRLRAYLFRDHRKLLLVDGAVAYTGGVGITDEFEPPGGPDTRWRETVIEIRGPNVAEWRLLFEANWNRWGRERLEISPVEGEIYANGQLGRVTVGEPTIAGAEIKRSFVKRIRSAERRVWMCTAYFVPSWKLLRALRRAARRGVDVRLLLPGAHTDHPGVRHAAHRYYSRLLPHGVHIFEYQQRVLHAKMLLCDNWASIGSSNVDRWNLRWNLEASQEVDDQGFSARLQAVFEADFAHSREYFFERWRRRSWFRRLLERLWGRVDLFLERLGRRRR